MSTTTPPSRDPALNCPSGKYDYAAKRCIERPVKNIGKGSTGTGENAAIIAACEKRGKWDYAAKQCIERPVKNIGKGGTGTGENAAIIAGCEKQGEFGIIKGGGA